MNVFLAGLLIVMLLLQWRNERFRGRLKRSMALLIEWAFMQVDALETTQKRIQEMDRFIDRRLRNLRVAELQTRKKADLLVREVDWLKAQQSKVTVTAVGDAVSDQDAHEQYRASQGLDAEASYLAGSFHRRNELSNVKAEGVADADNTLGTTLHGAPAPGHRWAFDEEMIVWRQVPYTDGEPAPAELLQEARGDLNGENIEITVEAVDGMLGREPSAQEVMSTYPPSYWRSMLNGGEEPGPWRDMNGNQVSPEQSAEIDAAVERMVGEGGPDLEREAEFQADGERAA